MADIDNRRQDYSWRRCGLDAGIWVLRQMRAQFLTIITFSCVIVIYGPSALFLQTSGTRRGRLRRYWGRSLLWQDSSPWDAGGLPRSSDSTPWPCRTGSARRSKGTAPII